MGDKEYLVHANPRRTAIPFKGKSTQILRSLAPKRNCDAKRFKADNLPIQ